MLEKEYPKRSKIGRVEKGENRSSHLQERLFSVETERGDDRPDRVRGELERAHPEIEPLPPTPITDDARVRLQSWGMSDAQIERLRDLTSSFRYDLCTEKAERIARNGGYLLKEPYGQEVLLPDFYDRTGRFDGGCGDLSRHLITQLHVSGYVNELNETTRRSDTQGIDVCFMWGSSRTHFNKPDQLHVWSGFVPKGKPLEEVVMIDPSFQEISCLDANGYVGTDYIRNPDYFTDNKIGDSCKVGNVLLPKRAIELVDLPSIVTLGSSTDRKSIYNIGFVRVDFGEKIYPMVYVNENRPFGSFCIWDGNSMQFFEATDLNEKQKQEVSAIGARLAEMPIIPDQATAKKLKDERITITF
jgi:hypothetical protein